MKRRQGSRVRAMLRRLGFGRHKGQVSPCCSISSLDDSLCSISSAWNDDGCDDDDCTSPTTTKRRLPEDDDEIGSPRRKARTERGDRGSSDGGLDRLGVNRLYEVEAVGDVERREGAGHGLDRLVPAADFGASLAVEEQTRQRVFKELRGALLQLEDTEALIRFIESLPLFEIMDNKWCQAALAPGALLLEEHATMDSRLEPLARRHLGTGLVEFFLVVLDEDPRLVEACLDIMPPHFRKQAKSLLLAKEVNAAAAELVSAVRAAPSCFFIADPTRITFASDEFLALTGYSAASVLGRDCRFLYGPWTDPSTVEAISGALKNEANNFTLTRDVVFYGKDSRTWQTDLLLARLFDAEGRTISHLGFHFPCATAPVTSPRSILTSAVSQPPLVRPANLLPLKEQNNKSHHHHRHHHQKQQRQHRRRVLPTNATAPQQQQQAPLL